MTIDTVEYEIRKMIIEARSGHNDGWVQEHYRNELLKIKELIEKGLTNE